MPKPDLSYCGALVRRFDNDRFVTALFAPAAARERLFALYAFNLEVARIREQARERLLGEIRLTWWREAIAGLYEGRPPGEPVITALATALAARPLRRADFDRLIDARFADFSDAAPVDLAALIAYVDATAGAPVQLALQALGADGEAAAAAGRHVGIAWGLTGLARAVPHHARARRIFLPAELNRAAGLDVFALFERGPTDGLAAVVERLADAATEHLAAARALRREVPRPALPALLLARLADGYLRRLALSRYDPFAAAVQRRTAAALPQLALAAAAGRF